MRMLLALITGAVLFACLPALSSAQDCLLSDDFELGNTSGFWEKTEPSSVFFIEGLLKINFSGPGNLSEWGVLKPCVYTDFTLSVDMRDLEGTHNKIVVFHSSGSVRDFDGYGLNVRSDPFNDVVLVRRRADGGSATLAQVFHYNLTGEWQSVSITMTGPRIQVSVNGQPKIDVVDVDPILTGWMGLATNAGGTGYAHAEFDNFSIAPLAEAVGTERQSWAALKARF